MPTFGTRLQTFYWSFRKFVQCQLTRYQLLICMLAGGYLCND
jgi:hypothetical protein